MLFHSQEFVLLFLPVAVGVFYGLARHQAWREWWLIAASLAFYGWWDVRFVPLLVGQTVMTWLIVELSIRKDWRWLLYFAVVANLAVLGLFKYIDFGATILEQVTGREFAKASLILPIGISFYTFELISYLVDRLRGTAPRYNIRVFGLFIVLFPHLIAGPIMRHNEIIPQFSYDPLRTGLYERIGRGLVLFLIGFVEKFFIADQLAVVDDPIFADVAQAVPTVSQAGAGALAFALQIFFDFVAYSNMAMGIGLMCGLMLPVNFNVPYRAVNLRRLLAPLAHYPVTLAARLCLHSARRQPRGRRRLCLGHAGHHGPMRPLARRRLDVRAVGIWTRLGIAGLQVLASSRISAAVVCRLGDHDKLRGAAVRPVPLARSPHRVQYVCRTGRTNRARSAVAGEHFGADRDRRRHSFVQSSQLRACHAAPAELARRDRRRAVGRDLRAPSGRRRPVELHLFPVLAGRDRWRRAVKG